MYLKSLKSEQAILNLTLICILKPIEYQGKISIIIKLRFYKKSTKHLLYKMYICVMFPKNHILIVSLHKMVSLVEN